MSRARVLFLAPVLAAGLLMAGAGPASAATPNDHSNCVGFTAAVRNTQLGPIIGVNGAGGRDLSGTAQEEGGLGQSASTNCS